MMEQVQGLNLLAEDVETLQLLAATSGARRIVEVQAGGEPGAADSTLALCEALRKTGGTLTSIVPGAGEADAIRTQLAEAGVEKATRLLTGDPMKRLAGLTGPVDLLFLAGEIDYRAALEAAMPRLRPGSIVVAHRARNDAAYLRAVMDNPSFETTVLEQGSGLGISLLKR